MQTSLFKKHPRVSVGIIVVVLIGAIVAGYLLFGKTPAVEQDRFVEEEEVVTETLVSSKVLGQSVENRDITAHTFGNGSTHVLFVGGVHGGYEWNSVILAEGMIEYFAENTAEIPPELTVHIIPVLNPDGLAIVTGGKTTNLSATEIINWNSDGRGRTNARNVDLNRNFACKWQPNALWRGNTMSAGTAAFSEPEAQLLREFVLEIQPKAAVFWHSIAGNVYGSECEDGILPGTIAIMNAYAEAGNYGAVPSFDAYPVTGDVEGWLASIGVPAITVELETRNSIEWQRNLAGTKALLEEVAGFAN